ncbi:hypothetical protein JCM31598_39380 [Desulfonatronum parangueonense]
MTEISEKGKTLSPDSRPEGVAQARKRTAQHSVLSHVLQDPHVERQPVPIRIVMPAKAGAVAIQVFFWLC